jgi:hypothetical protein
MAEEDHPYPSRDKRRIPISIFFKEARYYFNNLHLAIFTSCLGGC